LKTVHFDHLTIDSTESMLKYSCTNSRLVNWVLRQVNDQPGLIFPKRKGWSSRLKLLYPGDQNLVYFNVLVSNTTELLVFIPINDKSKASHLKCISNPQQISELKKQSCETAKSVQVFYIACEKNGAYASELLQSLFQNFNLMVLDYEKMSFVRGNFKNPRLEFRLSVQELDTDLIPDLLPENQQVISDGITNSLFYQNVLFHINQYWLTGSSAVHLRTALKNSIPYWKQYRKKDQQVIIRQIKEDLNKVFIECYDSEFSFKDSSANSSISETMIVFPEVPSGRKELNNWSRKQELALGYFRDEGKQISIEGLNFAMDSDLTGT